MILRNKKTNFFVIIIFVLLFTSVHSKVFSVELFSLSEAKNVLSNLKGIKGKIQNIKIAPFDNNIISFEVKSKREILIYLYNVSNNNLRNLKSVEYAYKGNKRTKYKLKEFDLEWHPTSNSFVYISNAYKNRNKLYLCKIASSNLATKYSVQGFMLNLDEDEDDKSRCKSPSFDISGNELVFSRRTLADKKSMYDICLITNFNEIVKENKFGSIDFEVIVNEKYNQNDPIFSPSYSNRLIAYISYTNKKRRKQKDYIAEYELKIIDLDTKRTYLIDEMEGFKTYSFQWDENGKVLLYGKAKSKLVANPDLINNGIDEISLRIAEIRKVGDKVLILPLANKDGYSTVIDNIRGSKNSFIFYNKNTAIITQYNENSSTKFVAINFKDWRNGEKKYFQDIELKNDLLNPTFNNDKDELYFIEYNYDKDEYSIGSCEITKLVSESEKLARKKLELEQLAAAKEASAKLAAAKLVVEKLAAEKRAAEKLAEEKRVAEKLVAEKLVSDRLAAEKLVAEKLAAERLAAEKLATEKLAAEKLAAEKREEERIATEKLVAEKREKEKIIADKLAKERLAAEKLAAEKLAAEKLATEKEEADRLAAERLAAEKLAAEKLAAEKLAAEKRKEERIAFEKVAAEKRERERIAAERLAAEKIAADKLLAEKREAEKLAAIKRKTERLAAERLAAEKLKAEKLAADKLVNDRLAAEKLASEKLNAEYEDEDEDDMFFADEEIITDSENNNLVNRGSSKDKKLRNEKKEFEMKLFKEIIVRIFNKKDSYSLSTIFSILENKYNYRNSDVNNNLFLAFKDLPIKTKNDGLKTIYYIKKDNDKIASNSDQKIEMKHDIDKLRKALIDILKRSKKYSLDEIFSILEKEYNCTAQNIDANIFALFEKLSVEEKYIGYKTIYFIGNNAEQKDEGIVKEESKKETEELSKDSVEGDEYDEEDDEYSDEEEDDFFEEDAEEVIPEDKKIKRTRRN